MIIEISSKKIDKVITVVAFVEKNWSKIRRNSISETVSKYKGYLYDWILDDGPDTWPDFHPMSKRYVLDRKPGGRPFQWRRRSRFLGRENWNWLAQFVTAKVNRSGKRAWIKFGKPKNPAIKRMAERARWIEQGHVTQVSYDMRLMFGAMRQALGKKAGMPGINFFPLKKTTTELVIKPHPITVPVFRQHGGKIGKNFERAFDKNYQRYERMAK